ncbi:MAG: prephenate dehydrogenase/arogenate dehydrogenase family protein [Caldilineales bacterium]|nr:prephenate dehydrogenase/arogenate dehydrogenase family protein [Caldilineales bacterium]MDW8319445.1 prephenate dehydrogenase/arogenate dehydrogenase family protein [Anaerolineae bacterium]
MSKPQITIVGLGLIGNSIGLALMQGERSFEIVGHDKEPTAASQAKKMKAVDRTEWNLIAACEGADLLILALPLPAIEETLRAVARDLKPGCVVMDTASLKAPALAWAAALLPDSSTYIATNPIVFSQERGGAAARADLFQRATWAICPTAATAEAAVKTAADLISRVGARPLFLEPAEHDSMLAAVEHLPALLGSALMASVAGQPAWREMRQLAGSQFESATHGIADAASVLADLAVYNRENLSRWIDLFVETLRGWQEAMVAGDRERLAGAVADADAQHSRWLQQRAAGRWEETTEGEMPTSRSIYSSLLFGRLFERKPPGSRR